MLSGRPTTARAHDLNHKLGFHETALFLRESAGPHGPRPHAATQEA